MAVVNASKPLPTAPAGIPSKFSAPHLQQLQARSLFSSWQSTPGDSVAHAESSDFPPSRHVQSDQAIAVSMLLILCSAWSRRTPQSCRWFSPTVSFKCRFFIAILETALSTPFWRWSGLSYPGPRGSFATVSVPVVQPCAGRDHPVACREATVAPLFISCSPF